MKDFIEKLPIDIIRKIIPYTYNLNNNRFLVDIKNYHKIKIILSNLYYNYWRIYAVDVDPEDKYWLINDIFLYANNYKPIMLVGYVDHFYNIFKRHIFLKNIDDINKYIIYLSKKNILIQINIFLGLLYPDERNDLVIQFIKKNNLSEDFSLFSDFIL